MNVALIAGFGADLLLGDPRRAHPVALFGSLAARLERRLWRPTRVAGVFHLTALAGLCGVLAAAGHGLAARVRGGAHPFDALVLWISLGGRSLRREAGAVADLLADGRPEAARGRMPALVSRDHTSMDADGMARAAVESVAENTVDAVCAPLLWAALCGPVGAAVHRATNTLDAMVGYRTERYVRFGWATARADDLLAWPAARLAAALTVICAPLAGGSARGALRAWREDGPRHPSPNAGRIEAAFAGALGVELGGGAVRDGRFAPSPPLGSGRPPGTDDIARARRLSSTVGLASLATCCLLAQAVSR
jgi:adenosylcobinamide-phosphate synthase